MSLITFKPKRCVKADLCTLVFCPDWFVTQEQIKSWYDDDYDDEVPGWYKELKEELLPIAWYPSRYWDWCIPEDEKKNREIVFDHLIC